ncbi:MAG: MoaD/ThiS family protein [Desulfitobacteriaceae bacterium]
MQMMIKLFATFREGRFKVESWERSEGTKVVDILNELNIKTEDVAILLRNGRDVGVNDVLHDGDIVSLFPPVGGG